jgi:DNA ligase 1
MYMEYFEFIDDKSSKFWQIEKVGDTKIITKWGRISGKSRETELSYDTIQLRDLDYSKKREDKIKKRYIKKLLTSNNENIKSNKKIKIIKKNGNKGNNKIGNKTKKQCPKGSFLNLETNRCNKIKKNTNTKNKICPPGKILNPTTNRCNKIKNTIKSNLNKKSGNTIPNKTLKICENGNNGKMVYDVKKGVMLAHTLKDEKTGKIKNPIKGFPQAPKGWYLSEKFDGYRAIWDGKDFRSRNDNIFQVPQWFKSWMPPSISLDGEFFMGRENFQKCGLFRKKKPDSEAWLKANITYQIFDSPSHSGNFEERQKFISDLIRERCKCDTKLLKIHPISKCPLKLTTQTKVTSMEQVDKLFKDLVKKGAEGVMLRAPKSTYESKRTAHLLKYKPVFDDECKIIGYKKGTGKYSNKLGAFHCQLVKNPDIKFYISGMDDSIRENYLKTHPLNTIVTFTYMGFSKKGIPRHPNYLRIRKSE